MADLIERLTRLYAELALQTKSYDADAIVEAAQCISTLTAAIADEIEALSLLHRLSDDRGLTDTLESRISFLRATLTKGSGS